MEATVTDLRSPVNLLKAADAGETVFITHHGRPAYELKKSAPPVDWELMAAGSEDWLNEDEAAALAKTLAGKDETLTHDTVP